MKKLTADLTTADMRQLDKITAQSRRRFIYRDKSKSSDVTLRPVGKRDEPIVEDEELAGIDLRRVKRLSDLTI